MFRGLLLIFDVPKSFARQLNRRGHNVAEGRFYFALPSEESFFQPGSLFRSVYRCEQDIQMFLKGVIIAHQVIDYMHGDRSGLPTKVGQ